MKINIRKGNILDMPAVLNLIEQLAIFEKEPHAVETTVQDLERDGFCINPLFETFVAEIDNVTNGDKNAKNIVGIALYYYRYSTWKGRTLHLEDLIVDENVRGSGCGFALYSEIIKQAKRDNVRRVEWNVLGWNKPAIDFYEKSGANVLNEWWCVQMDETGIDSFLEKFQ